jgi:autotransporter-associated beta strand protein
VNTNGIQFGGSTGATTYGATSTASLELSGGSLYIGAAGITKGSDAAALPSTIKLLGGTLGANLDWSSSHDMKLGAATIQAQDASATARNITLSGVLSDDSSAGSLTKTGAGTLTLSGANTYTGATIINAGTLALGENDVLPDTTSVSIGAATLDAAAFADSVGSLDVTTSTSTINLGPGATLAFADSSAIDWTSGTLNISGDFIPGTSLRFGTSSEGLTADQLAKISAPGFSGLYLDEYGYLTIPIDNTPPELVSIVDNVEGGQIPAGTVVTYTVTFNEAMDAYTVTADDFVNAGTATCTIENVLQVSPVAFTVQATNTTAGTLILQIPTTASISDLVGLSLDCDPALDDDTTITVNNSPAPTLSATNITDDKTGQSVVPNMVVTYTLTFSEDIDHTTVTAADFGNAGTATITIGTIIETAPGVFNIEVTPTNLGSLQLMVNAGAVIKAASTDGLSPGNLLNTNSAIVDATTITVGSYLFWDTVSGDGIAITSGSGDWNLTAGNSVWNNYGSNLIWSQTATNDASKAAVFAGADGSADPHVVTIGTGTTMAAESIAFESSGYQITGGTLALMPNTSTSGPISVAAGKTATINSAIAYTDDKDARITANAGATLNLGGGATNSQYRFQGAGTINMTAGSYTANVGFVNVATFNQSGGTFIMSLPAGTDRYNIGSAAGQSVTYTLSGGTISANAGTDARTNSHLAIGRAAGNTAYANILNVQGEGVLNVGTSTNRSGELHIANTANANGTLNVTGGTVTIGTGKTANKIYFFKAGSNAGYRAEMTQSGGTVTANGIQFGGSTGATTYDATSSARLELSGGNLYIGAQGITKGSEAADLPTTIKLLGGTLGASAGWSSSLDMKIGAITVRGGTPTSANNITLSGVLSDDSSAGTLTKTGSGTLTLSGASANTYTGATTVNAGTLVLSKANAVSSASSLTIADGAALTLNAGSNTVSSLTVGAATLNFNVEAGGHSLVVNDTDGVTNSGAAGSVTINITGSAPASGTYTLIDYGGTLQDAGFSAYTLGNTPAGKYYVLANDTESGAVQLVVSSFYVWSGSEGSEWSTNTIDASKNWTQDGGAIDYTNDFGAIFDSTASSFIVDISGADVTPLSVAFNSGTYTLQGTHTIAGPGSVTVASGATLKLGSSDKLPDGAGAGNVTINGTLDLNGNSDTINALTGSGTVDNTAADTTSTLTIDANVNGNFSGSIKNTGGTLELVKTGAVDAILSGSNSYSGATTINQGRLFISNANALSPNTAVTVNNGGSFILNASGSPTYAQSITLNSGANLVQRQSATLSNVILPGSGSVIFNNDGVTTKDFTLSSAPELTGELTVQVGGGSGSAGTVALGGIISGSGGSLVKTGTGKLILRGANTFDGGVIIKNGTLESQTTPTTLGAGTVTMGGAGSAGATFLTGQPNSNPFVINTPDSGNIVIGANGAGSGFTMSGGFTLNGDLTLQTFQNVINGSTAARLTFSGGVTGDGNLLLSNIGEAANTITFSTAQINHTGTITVTGSATGDTTISAPIGANVTGITQNSATSTLVLSGSNSYACDLTVNAGTVQISDNSNTANDVSTVSIASGGTLDLTYIGTDMIAGLIIDGVEQPAGVYGKVGSTDPSVTQQVAQITGDGTLTIGSEITVEYPVDTEIVSGDSQDFGSIEVNSNTELTFTIRNSGSIALNLGTPAVVISGTDADDFTVTAGPTGPVAAGSTTTLTVQFAPSAEGERSAVLTINNDDSNESSYVINLTGSGTITNTGAPEIVVEQPAETEIVSNGSQDFGTVALGSDTSLTFTIRNSGTAELSLTGNSLVAISGADAADFTVTTAPSASVAAAGTTTFVVTFAPSAAGERNATLTIESNDSDEGSYVINLTGTGQSAFDAWSGGAAFDADANGDGVSNGLAWILGAADPSTDARSLLPTVSTTATNMVFTFKRTQASINAGAALSVEVGTTLAAWSTTYTVGADTAGSTSGVTIAKDSPSAGTDTVTVTVARGADGKKFARLKAVQTP